jgi:SAM-dependent methyltransferase
MDGEERATRAASFGSVADSYATYRPTYPEDAVRWLVGERPAKLLELGAGTGKLTAVLHRLGHRVVATDPDAAMLARLRRELPKVEVAQALAEDIPLSTASVDAVVASQAFHWFDADHALPEIARVLRPGGVLAIVWNMGDFRVPWVRKVFGLVKMGEDERTEDPFEGSGVFRLTDRAEFKHRQTFTRDTMTGFVASTSYAATLADRPREALLGEAGALYDSFDRGPDGLQMPWLTYCYRGRVAGLDPFDEPPPVTPPGPEDDTVVISFS